MEGKHAGLSLESAQQKGDGLLLEERFQGVHVDILSGCMHHKPKWPGRHVVPTSPEEGGRCLSSAAREISSAEKYLIVLSKIE